MSAVRGSAKPPVNSFNEENEALYDPYVGFELNNLCADLPWPEWNDAELNAEAWDELKAGKVSTVVAGTKAPPPLVPGLFIDPQPLELPPPISYYVGDWKRPQELFPGVPLTVYDPSNDDFELQVPSEHSSRCNFLKVFIEHLKILQFYAVRYGFPVEMETLNYVPNTQGDCWRPWHHVYALCKAGKGQTHKPQYCPYGKYVLRLFYMGAWRKFTIDDRIPCDEQGNCLLPVTQTPGELWPIILAKGLLKILSLTPSNDFSVTDFPLVSAFTGWTHGYFATENKSNEQVWRRLGILTPQYEQSDKNLDDGTSQAVSSKNPNAKSHSKKESSKKYSRSPEGEVLQGERFCILFASLLGFSVAEDLPVDCTVAVTMTRDCPLVKANKREGTKPWKRIRWIYWAKERGLWVDENKLPPYRRLHIVNLLPFVSQLLLPDPKMEAVLYDIPIPNEDEEEVQEEEGKPFEPEQWCDFLRFLDYLSGVDVFFKPSYFSSNFKVSCLKEKMVEGPRQGKGTSKQPDLQNVLIFPTVLKQNYNEPIYLLCESLTGIFLCISLWVCPQKKKINFGYLESEQPKILKVGHGALVVEVFDWRFVCEGEIIGFVKTVGYASVVLNLKPGRHVLKLWLNSDSSYIMDINSNVNVVIGKSPKLRFMMKNESQLILQYINDVSNSFIALTSKFGKPDLPAALRDFYETIKPRNDSDRGYYRKLDDFIQNFIECIVLTVKDLIPSPEELLTVIMALRSLFLDPSIMCDLPPGTIPSYFQVSKAKKPPPKKPSTTPSEGTSVQEADDSSKHEDKVVTIQRIFRGFRVRLLWKYQNPARKELKPFSERLKKVCDLVFSPAKRELEVGKLLRRIVMNKSDLLTTFKFYKDFSNVLQVDEFTGKIPNVEPLAWIPIARFVVATHTKGLVPCVFYLSCNLEQAVVLGYDNDTDIEIFRKTNAMSPYFFQNNMRGYTILVFGWNEATTKTVNWRLEMVRMKYFQSLHLCNILMSPTCQPYSMPSLDLVEVKNFYVPNSKSRILRCLIKIQKPTHLTLRLSLSYSYVHFILVIAPDERYRGCTGEEPLFREIRSTNGVVLMPSLLLEPIECNWNGEGYPDSDATVYIVEAYMLYNSWPLTKQEWGLIEPIRVNGESWKESTTGIHSKRGGSESRRKLNRTSRRSINEQKIESPFWLLQVLCDFSGADAGEAPVIEEDKSYAESVKQMKLFWEEKDPGRRKRGRELRMNFLHMMYLEEKKNSAMYGEDYGEDYAERNEETNDDPQKIVDRLASFSYLINDPSPTRYVCSPRILPNMPLKQLLLKYGRFDKVFTEIDEEPLQSVSETTDISSVVVDLMDELEDERKASLQVSVYYRGVMANWWEEQQKLSVQLMEQAYETRANLLERMQNR